MCTTLEPVKDNWTPTDTKEDPANSVDKWLVTNKAEEFIELFQKAGYEDIEYVTPEVIKNILKDKPQGKIDRLVSIRSRELEPPKPLPAPELKPGLEIDTSALVLKGDNDIPINIPDLKFSPASGSNRDVISAAQLTQEQWLALAINSNMLMGIDLNSFFEEKTSTPETCFFPVLKWKVPESNDFYNCMHLSGRISTEITYTAKSASMVAAGFTSLEASVSTPWVSGSVKHENEYKNAQANSSSELFIVGMYDFDRVMVDLKQCTVVSDKFINEIKDALKNKSNEDNYTTRRKLEKVFEKYGHVIGSQVTLGGRLFFIHTKSNTQNASINSVKVSTSAAISAAYGKFSGSANMNVGKANEGQSENQQMSEKISFQAIGGDVTLANNPENWKDTIKIPELWELIRYDKLIPTIELLPEDLKDNVLQYWYEGMPFILTNYYSSDGVSGFKFDFGMKMPELSLRYWARKSLSEEAKWVRIENDCGSREPNASALCQFSIHLIGRSKYYEFFYRAKINNNFTDWVRNGEICGIDDKKIQDIEFTFKPTGSGILKIPARSCIEQKNMTSNDGKDMIVSQSKNNEEKSLKYNVYFWGNKPVRRRLDIVFSLEGDMNTANKQHIKLNVRFNQDIIAQEYPLFPTGSLLQSDAKTWRLGVVNLLPGENTLCLTWSDPVIFGINEFRLVPEVISILPSTLSKGENVFVNKQFGIDYTQNKDHGTTSEEYEFIFKGKKPVRLNIEAVYTNVGDAKYPAPRRATSFFNNNQSAQMAFNLQTQDNHPMYCKIEKIYSEVEVLPGKNTLKFVGNSTTAHLYEIRLVHPDSLTDFDFDEN